MFRDAVVRGGPKNDLFRKDFRGIRTEEFLRSSAILPHLNVRREMDDPKPVIAKPVCKMVGYGNDCEHEAVCDKKDCFWHNIPTC